MSKILLDKNSVLSHIGDHLITFILLETYDMVLNRLVLSQKFETFNFQVDMVKEMHNKKVLPPTCMTNSFNMVLDGVDWCHYSS